MGRMRFRRSKGIPLPVKMKCPSGRPKKEECEAALKKIRINGKLLNIILEYREADCAESYNDTILRMLNRKTQIIVEQSERIKQLEYEILHLIPTDASPSISISQIDDRDSLENISAEAFLQHLSHPSSPSPSPPSPAFSCHHKNCNFHTDDESEYRRHDLSHHEGEI